MKHGLCACGCGQPTRLAPQTRKARGWVLGMPLKFLAGHNKGSARKQWKGGRGQTPAGYVSVSAPSHPKAHSGRVSEHVLVAEAALGRWLPAGAEVHHVDGNPSNNAPSNLVICQDAAYHLLLHKRMRALAACGHADWRPCCRCGAYDAPSRMSSSGKVRQWYHLECVRRYKQRRKARVAHLSDATGEP